ncbi:MAG: precorrin-3B synthase [Defluviicoccus sp.]|nr:precorrin-3B synthase [Defluviicoccus sp.]MDE0275610.1 precorrin-3B synthase [Defluviicoccus sp.]
MNAPTVKGRCPSLMSPMEAGDGLLVRVKPRAATLAAEQADAVAEAAGRYGNGIVELTNRGHLQIRGLSHAGIEGLCRSMAESGLAGASPRAEAVRNVLADPLGPDDPRTRFDSHDLARRLSLVLEDDPALHALPDKFGILVDAGIALPLAGCTADIAVRSEGGGATLSLGGGDRSLPLVVEAVEDAVRRLLSAFLSWLEDGDRHDASRPPRMRTMVAACGAGGVFRAAGLHGETRPDERAGGPATRPLPGFVQVADGPRGCFLLGAPFGGIEAEKLAELAEMARLFSDGTIRISPWRAAVLCGVSRADTPALRGRAAKAGFVVEPDDPRVRIVACAGRPRCASAEADTRADAALVAASGRMPEGIVHVSGCAKGCAHPSPAAVVLLATPRGYDLIRNGGPVDTPERTGLTPEEAVHALASPPGTAS